MNVLGFDVDAVLFDCDGVLIDSEPLSYRAWATALETWGHALDEDDFAATVGGTEEMVAARYAPIVGADPRSLELQARRSFERLAGSAAAFADAVDLVECLESAGLPVAVATNGLRWRLDALLGAVALTRLIPRSVTSDEVARPKPAPDVYRAAARIVGVDPRRCLVVEDSPTGIAAAVAAGARVVAVERGMFPRQSLTAAHAVVARL